MIAHYNNSYQGNKFFEFKVLSQNFGLIKSRLSFGKKSGSGGFDGEFQMGTFEIEIILLSIRWYVERLFF